VTPAQTIPDEGFHENPGAFPDLMPPETRLRVQFANGRIDDKYTYTPSQLRWNKTGYAWDIAAVEVV